MIDSKAIYAIFKSIIADKAKEQHKPSLSNMESMKAMLFCLVSSYDIEQEEQSQALYCENVKAKVWPDYDKDIKCK